MLPPVDDRRAECVQAGLDCRTCIEASAASIARLSANVSHPMLVQLFSQMYPDQACARYVESFVVAYRQSGAPAALPKGPGSVKICAQVAVCA